MDQTVNANLAACIQSQANIGYNTYYNICDGTKHVVPWGALDWAGAVTVVVIVAVIVLAVVALIRG